MRYEIDSDNAIRVWNDGEETPFLFQPDWPDGSPWADAAEAESWAIAKIQELEDPDAFEAPNYRGAPPSVQYRKIKAEKEIAMQQGIAKLMSLGLTEDEAKAIAGTQI
jgi:hypothetical protein